MNDGEIRRDLAETMRWMVDRGLVQGTSGNVSARVADQLLITPSGVPPEALQPEMMAAMPLDGGGVWEGPLKPSSEWRFHLDIARARPDAGAIVHARAL